MAETVLDRSGLEVLDLHTCERLLSRRPVGRIGFVHDGDPVILPVNYAWVGGAILIRTAPGSKLDAAAMRQAVAFEVDDWDATYQTGWSVLVRGVLEELDGDQERAYERVPLTPWARGGPEKTRWLRLRADEVTGRRLR